MGNTVAQTAINKYLQESISTMNQTAQTCSGDVNQKINLTFDSCGDISLKDVDLTQFIQLSTDCIQQGSINNDQRASITEKMVQLARSVTQNVDFNPGSTDASDMIQSCVILNESVINTVTQSCNLSANQVVNLTVDNKTATGCIPNGPVGPDGNGNHDYSGIDFVGLNVNQGVQGQIQCLQKIDIINQQISTIEQIYNQSATAVVQNALAWILLGIACIIAAMSLTAFASGPAAWFIAFALIIILFFAVAFLGKYMKWYYVWPFKRSHSKDDRQGPYYVPKNWAIPETRSLLAIPYMYLNNCDRASWPAMRELMFPDIPSTVSDSDAAIGVITANANAMPSNINQTPQGTCQQCSCSCTSCRKANPTNVSMCDSQCMFSVCQDDNSQYDPRTCKKKSKFV